MSEITYTAPLHIKDVFGGWIICQGDNVIGAANDEDVYGTEDIDHGRARANAQLWVTSPDLLQAAKAMLAEMEAVGVEKCDHDTNICWCGWNQAIEAGRAAIAKATGAE